MSQRTDAALAKLDDLLAALKRLPGNAGLGRVVDDAEALRRAVGAFHMEAIRFRMYSVDRDLKAIAGDTELRRIYDEVRDALEAGGFHTRSHTAP